MDWNVVAQYLPLFEKAAWLTLRLGLAGIALAIVIGLVCALVQYYKVPVLRRVVGFYIQLSRNTPLLVQLFFIYFANRLAEDLGVKVNYVSTEAANRIEYLQTGKVDVILANFTVTPERRGGRFCAALHERCTGRRFPGLQRHHVAGQLERR